MLYGKTPAELAALCPPGPLRARLEHELHERVLNAPIEITPKFAAWDYLLDTEGRSHAYEVSTVYESFIYTPHQQKTTDEVRDMFRTQGYIGCTAALIAFVKTSRPEGWLVTLPEDDRLALVNGQLCAPYFYRGGRHQSLHLNPKSHGWAEGCSFIGFRPKAI